MEAATGAAFFSTREIAAEEAAGKEEAEGNDGASGVLPPSRVVVGLLCHGA